MLLENCPISIFRVNKNASRVGSLINIVMIFLFIYFNNPLFLYALTIDFLFKATNIKYSPFGKVASFLTKIFGLPINLIDAGPKIFAFRLGFSMLLVSSILFILGLHNITVILALMFIVLTFLEGALGFCVGCYLYTFFLIIQSSKNRGFVSRIILFLFAYIGVSAIFLALINEYTINETKHKIEDVLLSQKGVRNYINYEQKLKISDLKAHGQIAENMYDPVLLSSTYITREINSYYNIEREALGLTPFIFKLASKNPLNQKNLANENEQLIIEKFASKQWKKFSEIRKVNGEKYLYFALPTESVNTQCLQCHGSPDDAPKPLQEIYGTASGYNQKVGELNAIISIYAPLKEQIASQNKLSIIMGSALFLMLGMLFIVAERFIRSLKKKEKEALLLKAQSDLKSIELQGVINTVEEKTEEINMIYNSVKQGFIAMNRNLLVHDGHSLECKTIFNQDISNRYFPSLLYPDSLREAEDLEMMLAGIFKEEDSEKQELFLTLLPDEIAINNKAISLTYNFLINESTKESLLIVILNDISEKNELEQQMEVERSHLNMVVKVVASYNDFLSLVKEFKHYFSQLLYKKFNENENKEVIFDEIFRQIHTFKGSFSQYDMVVAIENLHDFESELLENKSRFLQEEMEFFKTFVFNKKIQNWLDDDIQFLEEILGESYFEQKEILVIERQSIENIENEVENLLNPYDYHLISPFLQQLKWRPFLSLIEVYSDYCQKSAQKLGKEIKPLVIEGEVLLVDESEYRPFIKSLVHIFNNIIDHALEFPDDRLALDKATFGEIGVGLRADSSFLYLTISDDGSGINIENIKRKALNLGIETDAMCDEDIINLIFMQEFSTKEGSTSLSGRGVGLASVKYELELLGGKVSVATQKNCYTKFHFKLPIPKHPSLPVLNPEAMIDPLSSALKTYVSSLGLDVASTTRSSLENEITLSGFSAMIRLEGIIDGTFILNSNAKIAAKLLGGFGDDLQLDDSLCRESVAETANLILGNTLREIPGLEDYVYIGPPRMIQSEVMTIQYRSSKIIRVTLDCVMGEISLALVVPETTLV
jgi:signal transduction histidine kinase/CheY-specific phosphatase CheX